MIEPLIDWVRRLNYPLRNAKLARRWIAKLPRGDVLEVQRLSLELVGNFPGRRKEANVAQVEALLKLDARLESVIADPTRQYTANYQKSTTAESRLWHAVFDLIKAFVAAYHQALTAGFPHAENKRWRAVLPWARVRAPGSASSSCSAPADFPRRVCSSSRST